MTRIVSRACLAVLLSTLPLHGAAAPATEDEVLHDVRKYRQQNEAQILRDYAQFLALPNVAPRDVGSTDESAEHELAARQMRQVEANADYIRRQLETRGVEVESLRLPGATSLGAPPLVVGRRAADTPSDRTLGLYAHYDGQPVDEDEWAQSPWQATLYTALIEDGGEPRPLPETGEGSEAVDPEWRLYARGVADDKAPIQALFTALDALQANGRPLTSNLVFLFEGEEEAGSPHLRAYFEQHRERLQVDAWLICDGPVHQSRRPQLVFGVRGYSGFDITVYGAARYLHSGHYGNWAPNPAIELAHLLTSMKDVDGKVTIDGFYDTVAPLTDAERAAIDALPNIDADLRHEFGIAASEAGNAPLAERLLLPSLNVRGMQSAEIGAAARNVIPTRATATVDVRLVPDNDPEHMLDLVEAHLRRQGYHVVSDEPTLDERRQHPKLVRFVRRGGYPSVRSPMDLPILQQIIAATERAIADAASPDTEPEPPILNPILGGSLPLYLFRDVLGAPLVIVPTVNHDNNQHAPNENLRLANLWYAIDLMASVLTME